MPKGGAAAGPGGGWWDRLPGTPVSGRAAPPRGPGPAPSRAGGQRDRRNAPGARGPPPSDSESEGEGEDEFLSMPAAKSQAKSPKAGPASPAANGRGPGGGGGGRKCGFCGRGPGHFKGTVLESKMITVDGVYCHESCAVYCPEVYHDERENLRNVGAAAKRLGGKRNQCSVCRKRGAIYGCAVGACKSTYHLECALERGLLDLSARCGNDCVLRCRAHAEAFLEEQAEAERRVEAARPRPPAAAVEPQEKPAEEAAEGAEAAPADTAPEREAPAAPKRKDADRERGGGSAAGERGLPQSQGSELEEGIQAASEPFSDMEVEAGPGPSPPPSPKTDPAAFTAAVKRSLSQQPPPAKPRAPAPGAPKEQTVRLCSRCRQPGHNIRSCTNPFYFGAKGAPPPSAGDQGIARSFLDYLGGPPDQGAVGSPFAPSPAAAEERRQQNAKRKAASPAEGAGAAKRTQQSAACGICGKEGHQALSCPSLRAMIFARDRALPNRPSAPATPLAAPQPTIAFKHPGARDPRDAPGAAAAAQQQRNPAAGAQVHISREQAKAALQRLMQREEVIDMFHSELQEVLSRDLARQ